MSIANSPLTNLDSFKMERVRYFPRQLVTANDMIQEQEYLRERLRRHNKFLHGWGVVWGLEVKPSGISPWVIEISEGFALSPDGDEIYVPSHGFSLDLTQSEQNTYSHFDQSPTNCYDYQSVSKTRSTLRPKGRIYIVIDYAECMTRPVRVAPVTGGCDDTSCEYSRVRESFKVECLSVPDSALPHNRVVLAMLNISESTTKLSEKSILDKRFFKKAPILVNGS